MYIQSALVIVDILIVDSLVIVDRLSRPIVYFSMYVYLTFIALLNSKHTFRGGAKDLTGRVHLIV